MMKRSDFIRRGIGFILLAILGMITAIIGARKSAAIACSSCPGKGRCSGRSDCDEFLNPDYGKSRG